MRKLLILALIALFPLTGFSKDFEIGGIQIQPQINVDKAPLVLKGAGVRSKFFIKLYAASLYTKDSKSPVEEVVSGQQPAAVRLNILTGVITSKDMISAVEDGFLKATGGNIAPIKSQIDQFLKVFSSEKIQDGDQFTLFSSKKEGIIAYKNGKEVVRVPGEAFRQALLNIWLGKDPADKNLKQDMLGK